MWWPLRGFWPWRRGRSGHRAQLGRRGEKIARRTLRHHGLKILASNYRCPAGEIDVIALDPSTRKDLGVETLAFVEVKTRSPRSLADPESAVNAKKRRRLQRCAEHYLARHDAEDLPVRFDVVAIVVDEAGEPQAHYIPDAFVPTDAEV